MASGLPFSEVFGFDVANSGDTAILHRKKHLCPFKGQNLRCNKGSKKAPLGICSYSDGKYATTVCPNRFFEDGRLFNDVGRLAFGHGATVVVCPELRLLKTGKRKIGKVDYLVVQVDNSGVATDFAAVEVQSVYISGLSIRPAFNNFLTTGNLSEDARRRPDFRSSAQKRLIPQLDLKVPIFRRWGKKFFVAVDSTFFPTLPVFKHQASLANSEVTWLVYPFERQASGTQYKMSDPDEVYSTWADVISALQIEGEPPEPQEILQECQDKIERGIRLGEPLLTMTIE